MYYAIKFNYVRHVVTYACIRIMCLCYSKTVLWNGIRFVATRYGYTYVTYNNYIRVLRNAVTVLKHTHYTPQDMYVLPMS